MIDVYLFVYLFIIYIKYLYEDNNNHFELKFGCF